jgi:hypothetical protein
MKLIFVLTVLCAAQALAQDQAAISAAESACGPAGVHFNVKRDNTQHAIAEPEAGKALVYVIEDMGAISKCLGLCITTRVGLDGAWAGANGHNSYLFFSVDAGEHHLCVNIQSSYDVSHLVGLAHFTAEAGKIYYFRTRSLHGGVGPYLELDPIDSDEGHYLIASYPLSISHPHK